MYWGQPECRGPMDLRTDACFSEISEGGKAYSAGLKV